MWACVGVAAVGVVLLRVFWSCVKGFYGCYLASFIGTSLRVEGLGSWAVITGATDGIGKAYVFELARRGYNIILISRTKAKLEKVAEEVSDKHPIQTKTLAVDFTQSDIYETIENALKDYDVGILVNNVGMSYDFPEFFVEVENCAGMCSDLINCNVRSVTDMTRIILPRMITKRRGLIINLSSLSSTIPAPLLAVYGASKAYVRSFSESIEEEVRDRGVVVQCLTPGFVVSNMSRIRRPTLMAPSARDYVVASLRTAGVEGQSAGYFMHKLQIYGIEVCRWYLPGRVLVSIVKQQLQAFRKRAHAKKGSKEQ